MQELNYEIKPRILGKKDEIISFKCELHSQLQKAMKEFIDQHPNWDQYRIIQAAIAGFLMQKGLKEKIFLGRLFP